MDSYVSLSVIEPAGYSHGVTHQLLPSDMDDVSHYLILSTNIFLPGLLTNLLLYIYSHLLIWISKFARALHVVLMGGGLMLIGLVSLHRHCMLCGLVTSYSAGLVKEKNLKYKPHVIRE